MLEGAQTKVAPMLVLGMVGADMVVSAIGKRQHRSQSNKRETQHLSTSKSRHPAVRESSGLNRRWRSLTELPCPTKTPNTWTPYRSEGVSKVAPHSMHCHLTAMMPNAAAAKGNRQRRHSRGRWWWPARAGRTVSRVPRRGLVAAFAVHRPGLPPAAASLAGCKA